VKTLCNCLRRVLGSHAEALLGPAPEEYFKLTNALSRITDLPRNMSLTSSDIGHRAVVIAEEALNIRQSQTAQSQANAGGKTS
jgi:hypothetical protein